MPIEIKTKGEVVSAIITGEIDHHTAVHLRQTVDSAIDVNMPSLLVLDFSGVTFMDSSGIGLVMGRYAKLSRLGAKLHISNMSPAMYKIMKLSGMEKLATMDLPKENENENGNK